LVVLWVEKLVASTVGQSVVLKVEMRAVPTAAMMAEHLVGK
jgi:hypothetical protein